MDVAHGFFRRFLHVGNLPAVMADHVAWFVWCGAKWLMAFAVAFEAELT
jgi:hypothetical protein